MKQKQIGYLEYIKIVIQSNVSGAPNAVQSRDFHVDLPDRNLIPSFDLMIRKNSLSNICSCSNIDRTNEAKLAGDIGSPKECKFSVIVKCCLGLSLSTKK